LYHIFSPFAIQHPWQTLHLVQLPASKPLQNLVSAFVTYGLKNSEGTYCIEKSRVLERQGNTNGSGMASLAEIENFIASALQDALDDDAYAGDLFNLFRPCLGTPAFNRAKELLPPDLCGFLRCFH
jgi:hypothetical protein